MSYNWPTLFINPNHVEMDDNNKLHAQLKRFEDERIINYTELIDKLYKQNCVLECENRMLRDTLSFYLAETTDTKTFR